MLQYTGRELCNITLPENPQFRQYKIFQDDGTCIKIPRSIKQPDDLFYYLLKHQPKAVYVSVSQFYNPSKLKHTRKNWCKAGYKWASNIFLTGDLVIDFDQKNKEHLKKAITRLTQKWGFKEMKIIQTGRGYHLWVTDLKKQIKKEFDIPFERENYYKQVKRNILWDLQKQEINFDFPVSLDTRRVVRLEGSIYRKEGKEMICNKLILFPLEKVQLSETTPKKAVDDQPILLGELLKQRNTQFCLNEISTDSQTKEVIN